MFVRFLSITLLSLLLVGTSSPDAAAQTEGLPAIAREVYRPHTEVPPAGTPRVLTERLVTEPPIVPLKVVDDTPAVAAGAVAASATGVTTGRVVLPDAAAATFAGPLARYTYGFYDDGNADDNWYYDFYDMPKAAAAVVVKPTTDATPGFRTNWTYAPLAEEGFFSW